MSRRITLSRRITRVLTPVVVQLVALVLAHDLVFLARYGSRYGEALVHAGHGETWATAALVSLLLGSSLVAVALLRLVRLGVLVRRASAGRGGKPPRRMPSQGSLGVGALWRAWTRIGPRTAVLAVVLLTIQENLEHLASGQGAPGALILASPEYAGGLGITIAVSLAVGLVAALFGLRRQVLLARLRAARAGTPLRATAPRPQTGIAFLPPAESLLGRRLALRAPPPLRAAT